jgi:methionine-rich copper-binding protein CopC
MRCGICHSVYTDIHLLADFSRRQSVQNAIHRLKLAALISALMLTVAGMAQAESVSGHEESAQRLNHNFSSKRSYHAPVDLSKSQKAEEQFEGATLVPKDEDSIESKKERNLKQLRINSLGRRPYME